MKIVFSLIVLIFTFMGHVSCGFYIFGPSTGYIYTNHEWPKVDQYPAKKFKARAFAEHKMPTDRESYWEIKLTIADLKIDAIVDINATEESIDFVLGEEYGVTVVTWAATKERWFDKKPFVLVIATGQEETKTILHVTHSAKHERFRLG